MIALFFICLSQPTRIPYQLCTILLKRFLPRCAKLNSVRAHILTSGGINGSQFAKQIGWAQIRQGRRQERQKCNAPREARYAEIRKRWQRWDSEEPQASHRHRPFGSAQKRRKSSEEIQLAIWTILISIGGPPELFWRPLFFGTANKRNRGANV
jgi:hypothetical protein